MFKKHFLMVVAAVLSVVIASAGAALAYIFLALITPSRLVDYTLPLLAFAVICYVGLRIALKIGSNHHLRVALPLSLLLTLTAASLVAYPTIREAVRQHPDLASDEVLAALQQSTFPLVSVDAGQGFDDLQPLVPFMADKRIVALGEATHGTSQFFRMKHRLVEFLVIELGFRHFGMELSPADGHRLDEYIQGKEVDPARVLYWPWATQEVLDMLNWMWVYNASVEPEQRLTFHGIDPITGDRDLAMAQNVSRILQGTGPESRMVI